MLNFHRPGSGGPRARAGTRNRNVSLLILAAVSLASVRNAAAGEGGSRLDLKYEYFQDRNKVWNQTPAFALIMELSRKWSLGWEQEFDVVTGASRRLGSDMVGQSGDRQLDAVSGASKVEFRHSENPSLTYSHAGVTASGALYSSRERDYYSLSPAFSGSYDFNERNTTVGGSYSEFFDDFRPTGAFAGLGGKKRIRSLGATLAQSLTPLTLVGLTATSIYSWGYLGHPYNPPVDSSGAFMDERVPDKKHAAALAGQIVQGYHVNDLLGSVNLDARRYLDDWGVKSNTLDLKVSQYVFDGAYVRLRARYYNQSGAAFAKPVYTGAEDYRTGDIRFYPFSSFLLGAKISSAFPDSWAAVPILPDRWDVKFDYLVRDTRGDKMDLLPGEPRSKTYQLYGPDEEYLQGVLMAGLTFNL